MQIEGWRIWILKRIYGGKGYEGIWGAKTELKIGTQNRKSKFIEPHGTQKDILPLS